MKSYFSYIRVSTTRQGQTGTSLAEQREAIHRYAERSKLQIIEEFTEQETAAKQGRPVFNRMLQSLKQNHAAGVIIHKIDRSARNLRDWTDLGELIDAGIEIHFANESIDLHSRGGRLSADIQAVVAADYIRNLREETRKGFYGRIKQGLYPMPAPVGYTDCGKGEVKQPHPVQAPLVRQAFKLYATGMWGLNALVEKMYELGLRNKGGGKVTRNGLSKMLHNPFYTGLIYLQVTGELYTGKHTQIITRGLFNRVQKRLEGKNIDKRHRHSFLFRKWSRCDLCGATLIPELQKGNVYYRCQSRACVQKTVREELIEATFMQVLESLRFSEVENRFFRQEISKQYEDKQQEYTQKSKTLELQLEGLKTKLSALADALIDGLVDRETYVEKKNSLIQEEQAVKDSLMNLGERESEVLRRVEEFLELVNNAYLSYKEALFDERRELVKTITSNFTVNGKSVVVKLNSPFRLVAEREKVIDGSPSRDVPRTISLILSELCQHFRESLCSDAVIFDR